MKRVEEVIDYLDSRLIACSYVTPHSAQLEVDLEAVVSIELLLSRNIDVRTPVCNLIGPK